MRHLYAIGSFAVLFIIIAIGGAAFLAYRSNAALEPGILQGQMTKLASVWSSENTPSSKRTVNFLISDGKPSANKETFFSVLKRTFFRKSMVAEEATAFAKAFSDEPNTITWTHEGCKSVSKDEMIKELMEVILKADDLGAEINIITQGISAVSAIRVIKLLGKPIDGNKSVEITKLIAVGMNMAKLKKMDRGIFMNSEKQGNLKEWLNTWTDEQGVRKIEIYNQGSWKTITGDKILPATIPSVGKPVRASETGSSDMAEVTDLIKNLVREYDMKAMLNYMAKLQKRPSERSSGGERKTKSGDWRKKGNASNCKPDSDGIPRCNWHDAMAYCGGNLPTIAQLKTMYNNECTGGRKAKTCGGWYWSSEDSTRSVSSSKGMSFYNGNVYNNVEDGNSYHVRCR